MDRGQWDILIYHAETDHAAVMVEKLKELLDTLEADIGEEIKVASTVEHFNHGTLFDSMEHALERCSMMFILITEETFNDPIQRFLNNHALVDSINKCGSKKYVPVFEDRKTKSTLKIPSYIMALRPLFIDQIMKPSLQRTGLINTIKERLPERKDREEKEKKLVEIDKLAQAFKHRVAEIKMDYDKQTCQLQGTIEVSRLRVKCANEIVQFAREHNIEQPDRFLNTNKIDVSFATDDTSSLKWCDSTSISFSQSDTQALYGVDTGRPTGERVAVEHDDAVEHGEMEAESDGVPPPYESRTATAIVDSQSNPSPAMEELKAGLLTQNPENVTGETLVVPPCPDDLGPPLIPLVVEDMHSNVNFSVVPRLSSLAAREQDVSSMVAECSESVQDTTSLLGSQSHANLAEFDEESMSQFSRSDSSDSGEEEMDMGDNPTGVSLLDIGTGQQPLPLDQLSLTFGREQDDQSMIVEVDSTVGEEEPETPVSDGKIPPLRVMHRSYCQDDEDFDEIKPLEIDAGVGADSPQNSPSPISPGLGELVAHSWPRNRRGSDAGCRRPRLTNLTSNRFLSLSSLQSFSSRLFKLHHQPSLNNICELGTQPQRLDGIRLRYS